MYAKKEAVILERLRATLPQDVHVGPIRDIERIPDYRNKAPACWVVYDGYTVGARIPNVESRVQIVQQWFVVIATKSAKGQGDVEAARDEAGELCDTVIGALLGFHMGGGSYLRLEEAPGPEYDAGYCHVPLAFSNPATFKSS